MDACRGDMPCGVHHPVDGPFTELSVGELVLLSVIGDPGSSSDGELQIEKLLLLKAK